MNFNLVQNDNTAFVVQQTTDPDYWTIEGMRAKEFSVGIFIFLVICIVVLKIGEKILLGWIVFGIIAGVILGVLQLLQGRLF